MDARTLLKNYIDEEKIRYSDIAVATGINLNTLKSGLYNQKMSFEKFGKVAAVCDFDTDNNISNIACTYKLSKEECLDKLEVYKIAMANRIIHKRIESYVAEANQDTSFAVMCQIQKAAEIADKKKADIKWHEDKLVEETADIAEQEQASIKWHEDKPIEGAKPIPVPEDLPKLAEAVISHNEEKGESKVEEAANVEPKNNEAENEQVASKDFTSIDIMRGIVRDMKGMQAVEIAMLLQAIFQYKLDPDVNWLKDARAYIEILIQEHENGWQ